MRCSPQAWSESPWSGRHALHGERGLNLLVDLHRRVDEGAGEEAQLLVKLVGLLSVRGPSLRRWSARCRQPQSSSGSAGSASSPAGGVVVA